MARARTGAAPKARKRAAESTSKPGRARSTPSREPRVRLEVEERRAQLLDLGLALFAARNYDDIGIDDIARQAAISKGLLYHYFGSKRGFYVAVVRHAAGNLLRAVIPDASLLPEERAYSGIVAYLTFVQAHAGAYVALVRSGVGADREVVGILEETRGAVVDRILEEGLGITEPRPVFQTALRGWVGFVEAAALEWLERGQLDRPVLARFLTSMLVHTVLESAALDPTATTLPVAGR